MLRTLQLARQSVGLASPNPYVGAVLVDDSFKLIAEGKHIYAHVKHAEVVAIEAAGERARGAMLYLNLEPCCHTGRTGPCTEAIIRAGIKRVYAAMRDPNPRVAGQGMERLRAAGIEVREGLYESEAKQLNEAFAWFVRKGTPFVTLKAALSLDGKVAPPPETRRERGIYWISGPESRQHSQRLRQASDAIIVGVGTVIADDPLLTDRSDSMRRRPLLRVVLDSNLRLPLDSKLLSTAARDLLVVCARENDRASELRARGAEVIALPAEDGGVNLHTLLAELARRQIVSVIVEGGPHVHASFLQARLAHKIWLYYGPMFLGAGVPLLPCDVKLGEGVLQLAEVTRQKIGPDLAVEGYFRDPYGD